MYTAIFSLNMLDFIQLLLFPDSFRANQEYGSSGSDWNGGYSPVIVVCAFFFFLKNSLSLSHARNHIVYFICDFLLENRIASSCPGCLPSQFECLLMMYS